MKETTSVLSASMGCAECKQRGFFIYSPNQAQFTTCPSCGVCDYLHVLLSCIDHTHPTAVWYTEAIASGSSDVRLTWSFCSRCSILFKPGCIHFQQTMENSIFNSHFVARWKWKAGTEEFSGMPVFDNPEEWWDKAGEIEVLAEHCSHHGAICSKTPTTPYFTCPLSATTDSVATESLLPVTDSSE